MKNYLLGLLYPPWVGVDPWGTKPRFYVLLHGVQVRVPALIAARKFKRP